MNQATDLLEAILKKVTLLEKELQTNNFLLKTLLAKQDHLPQVKKEVKKPPVIEVGQPNNIPPVVSQKLDEKNIGGKTPTALPQVLSQPSGDLKEEKFAVLQIVNKDSKPVFLANIVITNSRNEQVFSGTTNPGGQWNTALPAGDYTLSIKRNAGTKTSAIDVTDMFTVSAAKVKAGKIILQPVKL